MRTNGTITIPPTFHFQTLDAKNEWNKHFTTYIRELDKKKPVIWGGDLNVAPTEIGKQTLYLPVELRLIAQFVLLVICLASRSFLTLFPSH